MFCVTHGVFKKWFCTKRLKYELFAAWYGHSLCLTYFGDVYAFDENIKKENIMADNSFDKQIFRTVLKYIYKLMNL